MLLAIIPQTSYAQSSPSYIFYGGTILTMDDSGESVEAVYVEDGIIQSVGSEEDILDLQSTAVFDLGDRVLLPSFIDSHGHWIGGRGIEPVESVYQLALSEGWTTLNELFADDRVISELINLDAGDSLPLRVQAYLPLNWRYDRFGDWYQEYLAGTVYSSHLRVLGVKLFADSWLPEEIYWPDHITLQNTMQEAHDLGYQITIHSVSDNATDIVLDAYELILDGESNEIYRHKIEHLSMLRDDQIQRMNDLGIIASIQLNHFSADWSDAPEFYEYLESEELNLLGRTRDLLNAGVRMTGGSDYPGDLGPSMLNVEYAVTREGQRGLEVPDWIGNQTITVEQALRSITIDAAYGIFRENELGSITQGKLADLVVLSDNPLEVPASEISEIDILMTLIDGLVKYCAPDTEDFCSVDSSPQQTQTGETLWNSIAFILAVILTPSIRKIRVQT